MLYFTSPILSDRMTMPALICASATHYWISRYQNRHDPNSSRHAALQSQQRSIRNQTRSEITLFEGKKSS